MHLALFVEARYPRLETVEAALCWIHRHNHIHRAPTLPGLWGDIGSLVGMAHELGLNVDPSDWALDVSEKNRRIRIAWALFIAEKWAALGLGRPSYISSDDWNVPVVTATHFSTEVNREYGWKTPRAATDLFVAMAHLAVILSEMLPTFYSLRAQASLKAKTTNELLSLVRQYEDCLVLFKQTHLNPLLTLIQEQHTLDPAGTLVLAFHTLQAVLYRAVFPYISPDTSSQVRHRVRDVLLSAIDFTAGLRVAQLRAFWWSPVSRINFAILGSVMYNMLFSSTDEGEIEFWTRQVDKYRQLLELHSMSFDMTKLAVKRLEVLVSATGKQKTEVPFLGEDLIWEEWVHF